MSLVFCCKADNDLFVLVGKTAKCARYETPADSVGKASPGSGVLILADGYPEKLTEIAPEVLTQAREKRLRLYIEYPAALPGYQVGEPTAVRWERGVVASDAFGDTLPKLRILAISDCRFVPISAKDPSLVLARVAGFDRAVFGLPSELHPILFEDDGAIVATTKLSDFVTARFAPSDAWKTIWEHLLRKLDPGTEWKLDWESTVAPAFARDEKLPRDVETRSLSNMAKWLRESRLLLSESRRELVHKELEELAEAPGPNAPRGDGSLGILEGYCSSIRHDGSQLQRVPLRSDCAAESAMVLALDSELNKNPKSRAIAVNLTDWVYTGCTAWKGGRGDPGHPAYGLIAWGDIRPGWLTANYSDDDARVMLATIATAATLGSEKWDEPLLRALLANLRTTGPRGFRSDRLNMPKLEENGWKFYYDTPRTNFSPHHESYLFACNLWAYRQTGYKPFLERTTNAIGLMMEAFPEKWRWNDTIERARMLLCLAWLVRVDDTPEHRAWLNTIADDLLKTQDPCGAVQERIADGTGAGTGRGGYASCKSNEAYGTTETPVIQENGDPVSDQLYTTGFALLGLHEAYAATGDAKLKAAEDKLADYLCRVQVKAPRKPCLDGCWFRAFDYKRWEFWASSGDTGWGAWSAESGWAQAWTAAVFGLRAKNTSFWEMTDSVDIAKCFRKVKEEMDQTPEGPWKAER